MKNNKATIPKSDSPFEFVTVEEIAKTIHERLKAEFDSIKVMAAADKGDGVFRISAYLTLEADDMQPHGFLKVSRSIKLCMQRVDTGR